MKSLIRNNTENRIRIYYVLILDPCVPSNSRFAPTLTPNIAQGFIIINNRKVETSEKL